PDGPERERGEYFVRVLPPKAEFSAPPADIDEKRAVLPEMGAACNAEVDEPRFLLTGDDTDIEVRLLPDPVEGVVRVLCLPRGRCRHCHELLRTEGACEIDEPQTDHHGPLHCPVIDPMLVEFPFPKPHDLVLADHDLVCAVPVEPDHEAADRDGADIEECDHPAVPAVAWKKCS